MDFGFPRTRGDALRICPVEVYFNWTEQGPFGHARGKGRCWPLGGIRMALSVRFSHFVRWSPLHPAGAVH